jgi:hypothetical protein
MEDRIYLQFEEDNLELWKHVIVWLDLPDQLCWQCKYCRNIYMELFGTDMIYRHLLSTESGNNLDFNCKKVIRFIYFLFVFVIYLPVILHHNIILTK